MAGADCFSPPELPSPCDLKNAVRERNVSHPLRSIHTHALDFWMARSAVVLIIGLQLWLGQHVTLGPVWLAPAIEAALLVPLSIATAWAQDLAVKASHEHHWHLVGSRRRAVRWLRRGWFGWQLVRRARALVS